MARLDEIAQGLVSVLAASRQPEPLGVDLWNEPPAAATFLVRAVIDECARRAVPLSKVEVGPDAGADLIRQLGGEPAAHEGVAICIEQSLGQRISFYRF